MKIIEREVQDIMLENYADVSSYFNIDRAISKLIDNKKPVQRRILYVMWNMGLFPNKNRAKCARIVGNTLAFHPHGDTAVYGSLVTLARSFRNNATYIDGYGTFGDQIGSDAAAPRYTEARLTEYAADIILGDMASEATVDFKPNETGDDLEPVFLPAKLPDVLINGNYGIGSGQKASIPPHNPLAVAELCIEYVKNRKMTVMDMMRILKAPDFPTGGSVDITGLRSFYEKGNGYCTLYGTYNLVKDGKKSYIEITELPFDRTCETFLNGLSEVIYDKNGKKNPDNHIVEVEDLSNADGILIRLRIDDEANYNAVEETLLKSTCLKYRRDLHMCVVADDDALVKISLKDIIDNFVRFRSRTLYRKFKAEIDKLKKKVHILNGCLKVLGTNIDNVIAIVKKAISKDDTIKKLMVKFDLDYDQAEAIAMMRIYKLSTIEIKNIKDELKSLESEIKRLEKLTVSESNKELDKVMIEEWEGIIKKYPSIFYKRRKTKIM